MILGKYSYLMVLFILGLFQFIIPVPLLLFVLLFVIAFPHGALDILKIKNSDNIPKSLFLYSLAGLAFGYLLFIFPQISLFFLFGISFFHFAHIEWKHIKQSQVGYIDLAFATLFIIPLLKRDQFFKILLELDAIALMDFFKGGINFFAFLYALLFIAMVFINRSNIFEYLLTVVSVGFFVYLSDLYVSFSLYFIGIHSFRHLQMSLKSVGGKLDSMAILFLFASSLIFCMPLVLFPSKMYFVFIILGALSLPHLLIEYGSSEN
jgi:Brp/Blh family beta-carotene 15,15'-monooxygenase